MRVPSSSSSSVRVAPQQERSARRLAGFLQSAEELFAEMGFEATTMQAIADRSGSSIGALYNYFPDKPAIAVTLRERYTEELNRRLQSLFERAEEQTAAGFAGAFIDCITGFAQDHPAWANLFSAPAGFRRDQNARAKLRSTIAQAFRTKNPALSPERALLAANVAVQIVKGMKAMFGESEARSRERIAAEFRKVLTLYLESVLSER